MSGHVSFRIPAGFRALLVMGCAGTAPRIPVEGSAQDLAALAGDWRGEYQGAAGGRSGLLEFHLAAGADTATGDVLMFPRDQGPSPTTPATGTPTERPN